MKNSRLTAMRELVKQGWTLERISDKYGITRQRVHQIVGKIGYRQPGTDIIRQNLPEIQRLRSEGVSYRQIGKRFGISSQWLGNYLGLRSNFHGTLVHGTTNGYRYHGCRCEACRKAVSLARTKQRHALRAQGLCVLCRAPSPQRWRCDACVQKQAK